MQPLLFKRIYQFMHKDTRISPRLFYGILIISFLSLLALPFLFGGNRDSPYFCYKIMWLNFLGYRFKLPMETPKPLFAAICGIIPLNALYPTIVAFSVGVLGLLMKFAQYFGKPAIAGFIAFMLFVFDNSIVIPDFILGQYWPMPYFFLILASIYSLAKKHYAFYSIALLGAGLIRPEAWLISPLIIIAMLIKRKSDITIWQFVPLLSFPLWALFDARIAGWPTYSFDTTVYYMITMGINATSFRQFWHVIYRNLSCFYLPLHFLGLIGLVYFLLGRQIKLHAVFAVLTILPFSFFWFLTLFKPVLIQARFFALPMLICCFYITLFLFDIIRSKIVLGVTLGALLIIGYQVSTFKETSADIENDTSISDLRDTILLKVNKLVEKSDIVLCGRSLSYLTYRLGVVASQKFFMFRDVIAFPDKLNPVKRGVAVYIKGDLSGMDNAFIVLSRPQIHNFRGFTFYPIYKTLNSNGIIYVFERIAR